MPYPHADHRDCLRVPDSMCVDYRLVGGEQLFGAGPPFPHDVTPRFRLPSDMCQIELEAARLPRSIAEAEPYFGSFLQTVNGRPGDARDRHAIGIEFLHRDAASRELPTRQIPRRQAQERRDRLLKDGFRESDLT